MDYGYRAGTYLERQIGQVIKIAGHNYLIHEILSESRKDELHEHWGVYEATCPDSRTNATRRYALKVRYGMRTRKFRESDLEATDVMARECFELECRALRTFTNSGFTPVFYGSDELSSDLNPLYGEGHVWAIVMSLVDGTSVADICGLNVFEKRIIQDELIKALEYMRLRGWGWYMQETEQIFYDSARQSMYVFTCIRLYPFIY
ncbi:uncharacterized protein BO97DRAFT_417652 [Aspergillus homomorphus CBS 101889]|uniref:Protein kinase domain-containing protein n=1 Tax=Aspergillus homomorphus (strain CBS 101889) TaxID=1450537 RepID=A0A395HKM2_ASPHC|nr:hypothetical protein BO97DRAFT_417652 [Aspergillus homomorphus CBS 101889]RAL08492.1 hypothetical protein BO97DRAFT_417652 [Aspergillus homomorphus CBS 101889]